MLLNCQTQDFLVTLLISTSSTQWSKNINALYDFNPFKFVETCLRKQCIVKFCDVLSKFKKNTYFGIIRRDVLYTPIGFTDNYLFT